MANPIYDNSTNGSAVVGSNYTNYSYNHTVGSFNNRILVVFADRFSVTGITFNGVALTNAGIDKVVDYNGGQYKLQTYYLLNPDVGTHSVSITWDTNITSHLSGAISFYNSSTINQPVDAKADDAPWTVNEAATVSLTIPEDNCVYIVCAISENGAEFVNTETEVINIDNNFRVAYKYKNTSTPTVATTAGIAAKVMAVVAFSSKIGSDFDAMLLVDYI